MKQRTCLAMLSWICCVGVGQGQSIEAGPLVHDFSLTLEAGKAREAAGPFLRWETKSEEHGWALHPFYARIDHEADLTEIDVLYPLFTYDRFGQESRWQIFQLLSLSRGTKNSDSTFERFSLFPFYFHQRSPDGTNDYTALFPFYGTMRNRLFRDEVSFVLWPLYVRTLKGGPKPGDSLAAGGAKTMGVATRNYLLPIFHVREGEHLRGWQCWPLLGHETQEPSTRTNMWGDAELVPGHRKWMALWPLFFNEHRQVGTDDEQHEHALLPLYTCLRSPQRDSLTTPWPFGLTLTHDRAKGYREWGFPWPFVVFARGPGKTTDRVWPLFSRARAGPRQTGFFLWPIYRRETFQSAPLESRRDRILYFLYNDVVEKNTDTGRASHRTDLWPLFTIRQSPDGSRRTQWLAPLEPMLPNNKSIERNWSPLWSLWRDETNAVNGKRSLSVLWNFYRQDSDPEARKCSLAFGLFQYQSSPDGKRWRVLGIPVGRRPITRSSSSP